MSTNSGNSTNSNEIELTAPSSPSSSSTPTPASTPSAPAPTKKLEFSKSDAVGITALLQIRNGIVGQAQQATNDANAKFNKDLVEILTDGYGLTGIPDTARFVFKDGRPVALEWDNVPAGAGTGNGSGNGSGRAA